MAAKKNSRKKPPKAARKKLAKRKTTTKKVANKSLQKKTTKKTPIRARKAMATKKAPRSKTRRQKNVLRPMTTAREASVLQSGRQAGDLQALSSIEDANAESVDELLEEGNAFEAEVVKGVEDAADRAERGVRTHEVPEDDVPEEYLDNE